MSATTRAMPDAVTWWQGHAAVVTGGARGQGASLARMLVHAGARVHVVDCLSSSDPAWSALRSEAAAGPGSLVEWDRDVSEPSSWEQLAQALRSDGRPLRGLVNNAGITGPRRTVTNTELADWDRVIAINLTGAMLGIRALAPCMEAGGAIVNISSTVGMTGYYNAAYSCTKWALRGLTRSAAMELAPQGLRVNCVCPGVVDTGMIRAAPALVAALRQIVPMERMAPPEQIADVVFFLLGPQAAYVTGADIAVDGGVSGAGLYWPVGRALGVLGTSVTATQEAE